MENILSPNEAIQNLSSMYNNQKLMATNIEAASNVKTSKLQLGDKWILSGVGDANDEWLRLQNIKENGYFGGFAADKFWSNNYIGGNITISGTSKLQGVGNSRTDDVMVSWIDKNGSGETTQYCPQNMYVCGARTNNWFNGSGRKDASGIIGLELKCCSFD